MLSSCCRSALRLSASSQLAVQTLRASSCRHLDTAAGARGSYSSKGSRRAAAAAGLVIAAAAAAGAAGQASICEAPQKQDSDLPTIRRADVQQHKTKETGIWVIRGDGVYDITEFIASHPGGASKIMMAAGGNLEPFWRLYAQHEKQEAHDILAGLRIGTLPAEDVVVHKVSAADDPFGKDPERHPALIVNSAKPYNAEPPPDLLIDAGFTTPNEIHYKRNHLPVPEIDPETYRLQVEVEGKQCVRLSLEDLKMKFPHYRVAATIQCAGNRREEMMAVKPVRGLSWGLGAISTTEWTGVRLRDVLAYAGFDLNEDGPLQHVQFEGLDRDMTQAYGGSIPVHKAVDPHGDVLLAFEMNGEPLPRDHGFPVRVVVPGVVGARSVKWLGKIIASTGESQNHWQQKDYKGFSPSVDWDTVDFSTAPAIQELPVVSAICAPTAHALVSAHEDTIPVRGYAWSGGGRGIVRVDVTADGGATWHTAQLAPPEGQPLHRAWAWTLWEAEVPVPEGARGKEGAKLEIACKATDASYNTQPELAAPIWNLRGVLTNHWHRVPLVVSDEE